MVANKWAYYNEFDPKAAAWLRELITQGHIAPGDVDERDLWDVAPDDIKAFQQVHLCGGIGVWSYALRRAGWADDRPVWTGSFPCQPFSAAGKGAGFADERHLWPAGYHLIAECRPPVVFGEQVASKDAEPWLDLVQADLEAVGYALGAIPFPSAGIGAPHIRDRLYWVADALPAGRSERRPVAGNRPAARGGGAERLADDDDDEGLEGRRQPGRERAAERPAGAGGVAGGLADANGWHPGAERQQRGGGQRQQPEDGGVGGLADRASDGRREKRADAGGQLVGDRTEGLAAGLGASGGDSSGSGPTNGLWRDADWLLCRDGKWRPVEPGTFPLAHGAPARVGCVCAACLESTAEGADDEDLRALRKVSGAADGRVPQEVLQPTMPVGTPSPGTGYVRSRSVASSASIPEHALRDVWGDGGEPPASSGREPEEQHAREHPDFVPGLPQQGASCERCGATDELYTVTITGTSRVAKLRGYGNAINAEAAQVWIESYIEATGESAVADTAPGAEAAV